MSSSLVARSVISFLSLVISFFSWAAGRPFMMFFSPMAWMRSFSLILPGGCP